MPKCEICGCKVDNTNLCQVCESRFCSECGDPELEICKDCQDFSGVMDSDIEEYEE